MLNSEIIPTRCNI